MNSKIVAKVINYLKSTILPILVFCIFSIASGGKFGFSTIPVLLRQAAITSMLAWALWITMELGGWNFSVAPIVFLTSILSGTIVSKTGLGLFGLAILCIVIATTLSSIVGILCVLLKVPSILVTIGCLMVFESMTSQLNGARGATIRGSMSIMAKSPYCFIAAAICAIILFIAYYKTELGYNIRAIGNSYLIAKSIGINIEKTRIYTFTLAGVLIGIGTLVYFSNSSHLAPVANMESMATNFSAMISVFLGNYISKYCNKIIAIFFASFTMKMLAAGLVAIGISSTFQDVVTGLFLIIFIGIVSNQKRIDQYF